MNLRLATVATSSPGEQHGYVRLHGRWPLVMRGVWLVALALAFAVLVASFPLYLALLGTLCTTPHCENQHLTPAQFAMLGQIGITPGAYVAISVSLAVAALAVCWTMSALIIWRRPDDLMAALVALMLIPTGPLPIAIDLPNGRMPWLLPYGYVITSTLLMFAVVFCLFPSGRFAPRWTRWILIGVALIEIPLYFIPIELMSLDTPAGKVGFDVAVVELVAPVAGQFVRYLKISTPVQRQQTKWVVIGLTALMLYYAVQVVALLFLPALIVYSPVALLLFLENAFLLPVFLAISFALAMLRYHLWEIDRLINRVLVYGALTLILTGSYAGLVIGLQALSRAFIGQDSSLAIVLSTLVIAALVLPLRRAIQTIIDRRFYRSRYDAARTLHAFSDTLRHEIRVEALREQLLGVVDEAMRPAHASLWLRAQPSEGEETARRGASSGW